jgi:hypothetical protein
VNASEEIGITGQCGGRRRHTHAVSVEPRSNDPRAELQAVTVERLSQCVARERLDSTHEGMAPNHDRLRDGGRISSGVGVSMLSDVATA